MINPNEGLSEFAFEATFLKMALGKVSGWVLVAVCLVAMADASDWNNVERMTTDSASCKGKLRQS